MATANIERWRTFWADKIIPFYPQDTAECYRAHAEELKLLFGMRRRARVLEIGCGNGALYPFLEFRAGGAAYRGVDMSESMLGIFGQNFPEVELHCSEGSAYLDLSSRFDLIFSNQVVQCFDQPMLERHIANARAMMNPGARLVCASIPWRALRGRYHAGALSGPMSGSMVRWAKSSLSYFARRDRIGTWYEPQDFLRLGRKYGLSAQFYGSFFFLYRFHAVLDLNSR